MTKTAAENMSAEAWDRLCRRVWEEIHSEQATAHPSQWRQELLDRLEKELYSGTPDEGSYLRTVVLRNIGTSILDAVLERRQSELAS